MRELREHLEVDILFHSEQRIDSHLDETLGLGVDGVAHEDGALEEQDDLVNFFNGPLGKWLRLVINQIGLKQRLDDRVREFDALVLGTVDRDYLVDAHAGVQSGEELLVHRVQTLEQVCVSQDSCRDQVHYRE